MWLNGSDNPPPPDVEQMYLDIEKAVAVAEPGRVLGHGQADHGSRETAARKMSGPYEYVAPGYWQQDIPQGQPGRKLCNPGGCGRRLRLQHPKTSMGPAVPPIESIRAMVGKDHLWPHRRGLELPTRAAAEFKTIGVFTEALTNRYGKVRPAPKIFAKKSQLQDLRRAWRAMYEA